MLEGGGGDRELGLALLMRQGMATWIQTWSACVTLAPATDGREREPRIPLPGGVRGEVTRLLVTMAFSAHQKERPR